MNETISMANTTINGMILGSSSGGFATWMVTISVFIITIIIIYGIFRSFRYALYGGVINGALFGLYKFSRYIGNSYSSGNTEPFKYFIYVALFIALSIMVGYLFAKKTKWGKEIEISFKEDKKENE